MPSRPLFLPRPGLVEKAVATARDYALTIAVAPMGYGKTTLARAMSDTLKKNAYYYATPSGPHDARFLWQDIFDRFEAQGMKTAPALRRVEFPETPSQLRQALELLPQCGNPVWLILDDYHHVTDPTMDELWETVIRREIPGLHLVLLSRTRPEMRIEELRIKGIAALLEQDVLAFSEAETAAYFRMHDIHEPEAASAAWQYSEGWPAALWLCLQSWKASGMILPSPDIDSLLASTVFSAYSSEERAFLMRLSVMESFTEQEAERLSASPGTPARLRMLCGNNAFLSYDRKTGRYQLHGIFRDFLRKELTATSDIDHAALYRLAGECCMERQSLIAAFRHFARAGRDEDLQRLLDIFLLSTYDRDSIYFHEEVYNAVNAIPWHVRFQNPMGYLAFVALFAVMWNDRRTLSLLEETEERFMASPEVPEFFKKRLQGEYEVIRGLRAFNDIAKVLGHYERAHQLLDGPSMILSCEYDSLWTFGSPNTSFLFLRESGQYENAVSLAEKVHTLYVTLSDGVSWNGGSIFKAEHSFERGECAGLETTLRDILQTCGSGNKHMTTALVAGFCLARLYIVSGNAEEALRILESLRPEERALDMTEHVESFDLATGYINACLGNLEGIPEWLREGDVFVPPHCTLPQIYGFSLTIHGKALLLQGRYAELAAIAGDIPSCAGPIESLFARVHGKTLAAIAQWRLHGRDTAFSLMNDALNLSRQDGIVMPLAEYGGHIAPLLRHMKRTGDADAHLDTILAWAERVARVSKYPGKRHKNGMLTPREREFMHHVTRGLSTPAIAEQFGVAQVTVKKALGEAYAKLGVANRAEAARRFIELYGDKD